MPTPSRFDPHYLERNWPLRGQKHELYEGGVKVASFVHSALLPTKVRGTSLQHLVHVTDWLPTIIAATGASLDSRKHLSLDGLNQWDCICGDSSKCPRNEVIILLILIDI